MSLPDWARAHGEPLFSARIRSVPEDFRVTEVIDFEFSGDGEHDYLYIEKTDTNTEWLARQLARFADVPGKDVGYSGLKDRNAVTKQWFSVPGWNSPDWSQLGLDGVRIVEIARHLKKLRRGAHRLNRFEIVLRGDVPGGVEERAARIAEHGVPNYFGEQRFGREGSNLELADVWAGGKRLPRHKRSIAISTIRSFVFNEALAARVADGSWNRVLAGDTVNLDGTGSVFVAEELDADLERRCKELDVHPAGELPGDGSAIDNALWADALGRARVEPGTRAYRLRVQDLEMSAEEGALTLRFALGRGAYATSVIREIAQIS